MTALAWTALTDFVLACEAFFVTGLLAARPKARWSAAWFWQFAMGMLALGALLGGIDHGFVEPLELPEARKPVQRATWLVLGLLTWFVFLTACKQFFPPRTRRWGYLAANLQVASYPALMLLLDSFAVVVVNYGPVLLLLLGLSIAGLRSGKGSWPMVAGLLIALAASAAQAAGLAAPPLDRNGLYHLGVMVAVGFLYLGGLRLDVAA